MGGKDKILGNISAIASFVFQQLQVSLTRHGAEFAKLDGLHESLQKQLQTADSPYSVQAVQDRRQQLAVKLAKWHESLMVDQLLHFYDYTLFHFNTFTLLHFFSEIDFFMFLVQIQVIPENVSPV